MSLADIKRNWLLKQLGLSASTASESDLLSQLYSDASFNAGVRRVKIPSPKIAGRYFYPVSSGTAGTNSTLGNNNLRLTPFVVSDVLSIDRIGAEITIVGEAGSKLRLGIYSDLDGLPDQLLLDAGQIAADSATVQELVCNLTLGAGVYWVGGVVQAAPTTQPTARVVASTDPPIPLQFTSIPGVGNNANGIIAGGVSGALPSSWSFGAASTSGAVPRVFFRVK